MTESNVAAALLSAGREDAPALVARDGTLTHGELRRAVAALSRALVEAGHRKGDRVGLLASNGTFFAVAYLAVIRAGLCAVPMSPATSPAELEAAVRTAGLSRLLVADALSRRVCPEAVRLGVPVWEERRARAQAEGAPPGGFFEIDAARDLASLMFTSGSTGTPRGVMVTHRNIAANAADIVSSLGLTAADRVLAVLPFHYCYGLSLLHSHLAAGASVVPASGLIVPESVLDELASTECTAFAGVPSTYQMLLRQSRFKTRAFAHLRSLQVAGGRLADSLLREVRDAHPGLRIFVMYGQTEATARLSCLPPDRLADKLGSIGRGLPGTRLEVLREDGRPVTPGSDEVGEIVASGDNVTLGYWGDPGETARYFRGGRLHTSDLARVDADGFLWVVGRAREFIKCLGHRVSPREVEDVLCEMAGVLEAGVVGVPDDAFGEAIHAFVVPRLAGALDEGAVLAHANARLPNFKVPQSVTFLEALPKSDAGKVRRPVLAALARGEPGGLPS